MIMYIERYMKEYLYRLFWENLHGLVGMSYWGGRGVTWHMVFLWLWLIISLNALPIYRGVSILPLYLHSLSSRQRPILCIIELVPADSDRFHRRFLSFWQENRSRPKRFNTSIIAYLTIFIRNFSVHNQSSYNHLWPLMVLVLPASVHVLVSTFTYILYLCKQLWTAP